MMNGDMGPSREAREAAEVIEQFVRDHPDIARKMIGDVGQRQGGTVGSDDALLDRVGADQPGPSPLERVLAAWRRGVHKGSDQVLVNTAIAQGVIDKARREMAEAEQGKRPGFVGWVVRTLAKVTRHGGKR